MEAICSSETSVETQRTTRRHIPEDDTLHMHNIILSPDWQKTKGNYFFGPTVLISHDNFTDNSNRLQKTPDFVSRRKQNIFKLMATDTS
jgi:hypothetical protein